MKNLQPVLIAFFLLKAIFIFAAEPEQPVLHSAITEQIEDILSGKADVPDIADRELRNELIRNRELAGDWLEQQRENLKIFLIRSGITILTACAMAAGIRFLSGRLSVSGRRPVWRSLLCSMAIPFISFCTLGLVFIFMLPLLHSLPWLYPWDARIFFTGQTLICGWAGFKLIDILDARMKTFACRPDNNLDELMVDIVRKVLKTVLAVLILLFIGQNIFQLNITALLAGAGVFGVAVAFASRETLSNFFGTLVIILDRPFRCGDRIQVAGIDGIVESVGMRSTRIQTGRESVFIVPNSTIAAANVENISLSGVIRYMITLAITYDSGEEKVRKAIGILHEIVDDFHGPDQKKYRPRVFFHSFGASALNIYVIMWLKTDNLEKEEALRSEVNSEILRRFSMAGIPFAYNTVTSILSGEITLNSPTEN